MILTVLGDQDAIETSTRVTRCTLGVSVIFFRERM